MSLNFRAGDLKHVSKDDRSRKKTCHVGNSVAANTVNSSDVATEAVAEVAADATTAAAAAVSSLASMEITKKAIISKYDGGVDSAHIDHGDNDNNNQDTKRRLNPLLIEDTFKLIGLFAGVKVTVGVMTVVSKWHFQMVMISPTHSRNWLDRLLKQSEIRIPRSLRLICMNKDYVINDSSKLLSIANNNTNNNNNNNNNSSQSTTNDAADVVTILTRLTRCLNLSALLGLVFDPRESHSDLFERIEYHIRCCGLELSVIIMAASGSSTGSGSHSSISTSTSTRTSTTSSCEDNCSNVVIYDLVRILEMIEAVAKNEHGLAAKDLLRYVAALRSLQFDWSKLSRKIQRCQSHLTHFMSFLDKYGGRSDDWSQFGQSQLRSLEQTKDDVEEVEWKLNKFVRDREQISRDLQYSKVEVEMQEKKMVGLQKMLDRIRYTQRLLLTR